MPIAIECSCGKKLNVKDALAGKRVRCPACNGVAAVPAAEPEFELVDDPPPPKPAARPAARPAVVEDEDDEPRPARAKAKKARDDDGYDLEDEDEKPAKRARFSLTYTVMIFVSIVPILLGVDPLKQTIFSMALTAVVLPLAILPFLLLLNDEGFVGTHRNGPIGNTVVVFTIFMASIIAIVAIPLEIIGGGS